MATAGEYLEPVARPRSNTVTTLASSKSTSEHASVDTQRSISSAVWHAASDKDTSDCGYKTSGAVTKIQNLGNSQFYYEDCTDTNTQQASRPTVTVMEQHQASHQSLPQHPVPPKRSKKLAGLKRPPNHHQPSSAVGSSVISLSNAITSSSQMLQRPAARKSGSLTSTKSIDANSSSSSSNSSSSCFSLHTQYSPFGQLHMDYGASILRDRELFMIHAGKTAVPKTATLARKLDHIINKNINNNNNKNAPNQMTLLKESQDENSYLVNRNEHLRNLTTLSSSPRVDNTNNTNDLIKL